MWSSESLIGPLYRRQTPAKATGVADPSYYPIQHKPKMRPAIHMMTNEALIGLLAFAKKSGASGAPLRADGEPPLELEIDAQFYRMQCVGIQINSCRTSAGQNSGWSGHVVQKICHVFQLDGRVCRHCVLDTATDHGT